MAYRGQLSHGSARVRKSKLASSNLGLAVGIGNIPAGPASGLPAHRPANRQDAG
jgi:hypothetical protein